MNELAAKKPRNHEDVLSAIAESIDIPEHMDRLARERYRSIGEWLERDESGVRRFDPDVSPQGSFLLGTVIRPLGDADEYDIDLVCKLDAQKSEFTMKSLKEAVGREVIGYAKAHNMQNAPSDGRRCWTLEYSDQANFHMDILPALPNANDYRVILEGSMHYDVVSNEDLWVNAIAITDNTHPQYANYFDDWPVSNPKGYAVWFRSRQVDAEIATKRLILEREVGVYASVDEIPEYKIKTPLQRSIQLLKRHRDTMFGDNDDKPISIIITTLAAHAYDGEPTIVEALRSILKNMPMYIDERGGGKWVSNPVNPDENFADKWEEHPERERAFFEWLEQAQHDFGLYLSTRRFDDIPDKLRIALSEATVEKVIPFAAIAAPSVISSADAASAETAKVLSDGGATKPWRS